MTAEVLPFPRSAPTLELEARLLGALLDLPDKHALLDAMGLAQEDFLDPRISIAFGVIKKMVDRRLEVDAITVCSMARRHKLLGDEHLQWLGDLQGSNQLTTQGTLQVASDLRAQARGRAVLGELKREVDLIERGKFSPARVSGVLEGIVGALNRQFIGDETAEGDLLQLMSGWDSHQDVGTSDLLPTGIKVLDDLIGGLPPKLSFIAGEPGRGKTAVLGSIIHAQLSGDVLKKTDKVGLFGLEDGTEWLSRRWISMGTGIPLKEVGWKKRTPEQEIALQATNERIFPMLQRVICYRRDTITPDEMLHRAAGWIFKHNVKCIYIDHIGEIDHRDPKRREEHWQQVAETVRRMRNFANRYSVPVVVLVHTTTDGLSRGEGPPLAHALAGGRSLDRKARLILGLWNKGQALRGTILKSTISSPGTTIEFERLYDAGLVTATGGRVVNLEREASEERKQKKETAIEESICAAEMRAAAKAKRKPAPATEQPPKQPEAQSNLFDQKKNEQE